VPTPTPAVRAAGGAEKPARDADPFLDPLLENMPLAIERTLQMLREESERVIRAQRVEYRLLPSLSCHGCKHPMDRVVAYCPRGLTSHSMCPMHFERQHGMTREYAQELLLNPPHAPHPPPLPACMVCSLQCPCKPCRRTSVRRAVDVMRRVQNRKRYRRSRLPGAGPGAGAGTGADDSPTIADGPEPWEVEGLIVPHELIEEDVHHHLGDHRAPRRGVGPRADAGPSPAAKVESPPPLPLSLMEHAEEVEEEEEDKGLAVDKKLNLACCMTCELGGELKRCRRCPRSWHTRCMRGGVPGQADDQWLCDKCADDRDESETAVIPDTPANEAPDAVADCKKVLELLLKHDLSGAFCEPVDLEAAPDYLNFVRQPVHLREIKARYGWGAGKKKGLPFSVVDFVAMVRRVWHNCRLYNKPGTIVRALGDHLSRIFESNFDLRLKRHLSPEELAQLARYTEMMEQVGVIRKNAYPCRARWWSASVSL
jgi:hypothetical protein